MTRPGLELRPAAVADLPQVRAIYNAAIDEGTANCELSAVPADAMRRWLDEHRAPYGVWVAERGDRLLGWTALSPYDRKPCFHDAASSSTYVHRESRGQHVGATLRRHLIEQARSGGLHTIINRILVTNAASLALTEQLGFVPIGRASGLARFGRARVDCAFYQLLL